VEGRSGPDVTDAIAGAVDAIGMPAFDDRLLAAVNGFVRVDHLTALTYSSNEGLQQLCVASRVDAIGVRSLTRDYVAQHHRLDPNFVELRRQTRSRKIEVRRHDPRRLKARAYQRRFYTTAGIVDKVSYLWRSSGIVYYVNLYRTTRTGHYAKEEVRRLEAVARLVASLVRLHGGRTRVEAAFAVGNASGLMERLVGLLGERLTSREQAVLVNILMGLRTEGIALQLGVQEESIKTFRKRAYAKLGISSQAELFARCLRVLPRLGLRGSR